MIKKAVVVLPPRPGSLVHSNTLSPSIYLGGITLIQRILYSLQWAGIEEGIVISYGSWPEVERIVQEDPRNQAFAWLSPAESQGDNPIAERLAEIVSGDFLLQASGWIMDRKAIQKLLQDAGTEENPLNKPIRVEASEKQHARFEEIPLMALVPGKTCTEIGKALHGKSPLKEVKERLEEIPAVETKRFSEPDLIRAENKEDRQRAEDQLFQGLIKSTESLVSRKFERKVSLAITRHLLYSRITPNQISIASTFVGITSAFFFLSKHSALHVCGALLLALSSIVDGCDGELARLRFQETRRGSLLDFLGDNLVHIAVFFCIGLGLYLRGYGTVYLVLGIMAALATLGSASAVFFRVFQKSGSSVISFTTPVRVEEMGRATGKLRSQIDFADKISNRDFIYLILILAAVGQLWIWPWFNGIGASFYFAYLLYLYWRMKSLGEASPMPQG